MAQPFGQTLRTYHRWVSTAAMILLTWVAVTGVALALDVLFKPRLQPAPPPSPPLNGAALPSLARAGLAQAYAATPGARPTEIEISLSILEGQALAEVRLVQASVANSAPPPPLTFVLDPASGQAKTAPPRAGPSDYIKFRIALHRLLEKLHRGNIIGRSGQWLSVLTGLSFIFLTVSGIWMYVDMLVRRRRIGKRQPFWN